MWNFLQVRLHPPHTYILQIMLQDNNSKKMYKEKLPDHSKKTKKKTKKNKTNKQNLN